MALQPQHMLYFLYFFGTNKTGTTQELRLFWTQPLSNNSWTLDFISFISFGLVLYVGLFGRLDPKTKFILCSMPLKDGRSIGPSFGNTSPNSFKNSFIEWDKTLDSQGL